MSAVKPTFSLNSTTTSSTADGSEDQEINNIKGFAKELLRSRIFLGRYLERRLVDERIGYRDIVKISPAEQELKRDLIDVQNKLRFALPKLPWIGVTDGEAIGHPGICIWTEIDNQPFGPFWFQIKTIKFRDDEILLNLKCIRHISEDYLEIEPILTGASPKLSKERAISSPVVTSTATLNETYNDIVVTLKSALTIRNVKEFITFLCAFVIAIFTGSTAFVNFLGNFILALIREMSYFVKNSTPIFLGFLDFLSKIVGGFYILVAMFFKPNNSSAPPPRRPITFYDQNRRPSIRYNDRSFD